MSDYSVEYMKLYPKGGEFRDEAMRLNSTILRIHRLLLDMHQTWDGNQWGLLAETWNTLIPSFNEISRFLVKIVPVAIESDAWKYAARDGVSIQEPILKSHDEINNSLPGAEAKAIKLSDEHASKEYDYKNAIKDHFDNIRTSLQKLNNILESTRPIWIAPAANDSRNKFSESAASLSSAILKVSTNLDNNLKDALSGYVQQEERAKKVSNAFGVN